MRERPVRPVWRSGIGTVRGGTATVVLILLLGLGIGHAVGWSGPVPVPPADSPAAAASLPNPEPTEAREAARAWYRDNEATILEELVEFLAIPNVAGDEENIRRKAAWIVDAFGRRGVELRLLESGGSPYVYGERRTPGAERTILFYCHYDGQPADPAAWTGHGPWEPVIRNGRLADGAGIVWRAGEALPPTPLDPSWRIYARSSSDDSGPIVMALAALDALEAAGLEPAANLKFLFEGDEEAGSPHVAEMAREHAGLWSADLMLVADGPKHPSGRPTLAFGVRGIHAVQLTVYGPARPLHSGHFGNWAPNPAMRLAQLLATMKDPATGKVLVEGWNDDRIPLSDTERRAIEAVPEDPDRSPRALGFAEPEGPWEHRLEAITYNSLNVRGMRSGWVGDEARTIVPDTAAAEIDLRLVADTSPERQFRRLVEHVRRQGFHVVREDPDAATRAEHPLLVEIVRRGEGYPAARTPMDLPVSETIRSRLEDAFGVEPVAIPTMGGSLPLYVFTDAVGTPTVTMPVVNADNNQHSPNENLEIGHLRDGIEILAVALTMP